MATLTLITPNTLKKHSPCIVLISSLFIYLNPVLADTSINDQRLVVIIRQLDQADRLAEQASNTTSQESSRYHFDYLRLRADLKRIRTGLEDYLVPQRAQPRDPILLEGHYTDKSTPAEKASP